MKVRTLLVLALIALTFVAACSGTAAPATPAPALAAPTQIVAPTSAPASNPTQAPAPTQAAATNAPATAVPTKAAATVQAPPAPTKAAGSAPPKFGKADIDKLFPPGKGQDLVFQACNNCHNWVPIVVTQPTAELWSVIFKDHRERVSGLSEEDYEYLKAYLVKNFGPHVPVPTNIPEDLLTQWTSY